MAIAYNVTLRNSRLDVIRTALAAATIRFYTGTRPSTGAAITSQTLLGTLTFSNPAGSASSGGQFTASAITEDSAADANGTATWARVIQSDGTTFVADLDVGATGSGKDIELANVQVVAGGPIRITSFILTEGNP